MLFGSTKEIPVTTVPAAPGGIIFDATTATFENDVIKASMETPVLVDFWAPWCGPCKQLGPVLEAAVTAAGGKVRMAKINIDENQELAQALRVQSIPTVYAFFQGQPVTAFNGARPASEVKQLVDQLSKMATQAKPDAIKIPEILAQAAKALGDGDYTTAQNLYAQILAQEENNVAAYGGMVRAFIAAGDLEQARYMLDDAPEEIAKNPQFAAVRTAVEVAGDTGASSGDVARLERMVAANPDDLQVRFDHALALFAAGSRGAAIDGLLEIVRRNKAWGDDKAKMQILKFLDAMGPADPETNAARRKLSSLLFS